MEKNRLIKYLIEERKNYLLLQEYYDEECSFPLSDNEMETRAKAQLKEEGKIP